MHEVSKKWGGRFAQRIKVLRICLVGVFVSVAVSITATAQQPSIKQRLMVLLVETEKVPLAPQEMKALQQGHLANLRRMAEAGFLLVAGPTRAMQQNQVRLAGVLIFKTSGGDERQQVEQMLADDPKIKAGYLKPEAYSFFFESGDNLYERRARGAAHGSD